ncbi:MAG: pentapeptide repeat-containing protein [Richelia sp. SM2_1_7]|nr:pentapeptide repeat-containing protein [Richelia sp. SM2_1_7]
MPPDYSGQNLRGRSYKGQNLEGADFSHADIRGTNFTGANLRGANFTGAKAGLQKRWALLLVLLSWLLSAISGFLYHLMQPLYP